MAGVTGAPIPSSVDEITTDWLTMALSTDRPGVEVLQSSVQRVLHGTSTKAMVSLTYNDAGMAADLPPQLLAKAGFEEHSPMMATSGIYHREGRFYREIRHQLPVVAPAPFYGDYDDATMQGIALMEDLSGTGAVFSSPTVEVSVDRVSTMLEMFARFHAFWWHNSVLDSMSLFIDPDGPAAHWFQINGPDVVEGWLATARVEGVPEHVKDPKRMNKALWAAIRRNNVAPYCFIHGDSHHGNSYFTADGTGGLYDWQTWAKGSWAHDIAYYVCSALSVEDRRRSAPDLVRHYLGHLRSNGADAPGFDEAWGEFRRFCAYGYYAWITNPTNFQAEENNVAITRRFGHAVADLESFELLGV